MSEFKGMNTTKVGYRGEEILEYSLPITFECWRYPVCAGRCDRKLKADRTQKKGKADADIVVQMNCKGCQYLKDGDAETAIALHEVKTNPAAVDEGISNNKYARSSSYTQNLYIELVQTEATYISAYRSKIDAERAGKTWDKNIDGYEKEYDPIEKVEFEYLSGIGWWDKRRLAYDRGQVGYVHAEWYHFYQPYDSWEWIGKKRKFHNKGYMAATEREIDNFLKDDNIAEGSILLTQYPVELCISMSDAHIEAAIEGGLCISRRSKKYADNGYDLHYKGSSGNALVLGYLLPIEKVVPCREVNKRLNRQDAEIEYTEGIMGVRTIIIGKFVQKGGNHTPIKAGIPMNAREIYAPRRIMGKAIKGGMLLYPLKPFEREQYNPQHKKYVPMVIEKFAFQVKPYISTGKSGV